MNGHPKHAMLCPHIIMLTELLKTECVGGAKFIVRAPDLCSVVHSDSGSDLQVGALRKKEKNKTTQEGIALESVHGQLPVLLT